MRRQMISIEILPNPAKFLQFSPSRQITEIIRSSLQNLESIWRFCWGPSFFLFLAILVAVGSVGSNMARKVKKMSKGANSSRKRNGGRAPVVKYASSPIRETDERNDDLQVSDNDDARSEGSDKALRDEFVGLFGFKIRVVYQQLSFEEDLGQKRKI
ncbi:hypothetical protein OROHE_002958 [Orobanche hederae]